MWRDRTAYWTATNTIFFLLLCNVFSTSTRAAAEAGDTLQTLHQYELMEAAAHSSSSLRGRRRKSNNDDNNEDLWSDSALDGNDASPIDVQSTSGNNNNNNNSNDNNELVPVFTYSMLNNNSDTVVDDSTDASLLEANQKIIGGNFVNSPGIYPYFSSIGQGAEMLCGATLIAPDIILTAAHCSGMAFKRHGQAIVDAFKLQSVTEEYSRPVEVVKLIPHPDYNSPGNPLRHDLLLVKIRPAITDIEPVAVNFNPEFPLESEWVTIMGFGRTENREGSVSQRLKYAKVPIVKYSKCRKTWQSKYVYKKEHICVFENRKPTPQLTCSGDSGGPLILTKNGKDILVGVLSFGTSTCTDGPSVFVRTSGHTAWLQNQLCQLSKYHHSIPNLQCP